jgi:hypothetical protein
LSLNPQQTHDYIQESVRRVEQKKIEKEQVELIKKFLSKDKENEEKNRSRMIAESKRIFTAAQGEVSMTEEGRCEVYLTLKQQQVKLSQGSQKDIEVLLRHVQDYTGRESFTEGFQSVDRSPIRYITTTMNEGTLTPVAIASERQVDKLFDVFAQLTDERVEKEVATRQTIREETDKILKKAKLTFDQLLPSFHD